MMVITCSIGQILDVRGETFDDSFLMCFLAQTPINFVGQSLHDKPKLLVRENKILAGIFDLKALNSISMTLINLAAI